MRRNVVILYCACASFLLGILFGRTFSTLPSGSHVENRAAPSNSQQISALPPPKSFDRENVFAGADDSYPAKDSLTGFNDQSSLKSSDSGLLSKIWPPPSGFCHPINEKIRKAGKIIVNFEPQAVTGGPAALHEFHNTLNELGFDSEYYILNPKYQTKWSKPASWFNPKSLGPNDFVLVPEVGRDLALDEVALPRGARILYWVLGHHEPLDNYLFPSRVRLASSHYSKELFHTPGKYVFFSPLIPKHYEEFEQRGGKIPISEKENFVLYDNDFDLDALKLDLPPGVELKLAAWIDPMEMPALYRKAKAVVDLNLPGVERMTFEGALFDAGIVLAADRNGLDEVDFPIPNRYKIDAKNTTELSLVLSDLLTNYEKRISDFSDLKKVAAELPKRFRENINEFFSGNVAIFGIAPTMHDLPYVWSFVFSAVMQHPLASIEVLIPCSVEHFKESYAGMEQLLWRNHFMPNVKFTEIPQELRNFGQFIPYVTKHGFEQRVYTMIVPIQTFFLGNSFVNCWANLLDNGDSWDLPFIHTKANALFFETKPFYQNYELEKAKKFVDSHMNTFSASSLPEFLPKLLQHMFEGNARDSQVDPPMSNFDFFNLNECGQYKWDLANYSDFFEHSMWHAFYGSMPSPVRHTIDKCLGK